VKVSVDSEADSTPSVDAPQVQDTHGVKDTQPSADVLPTIAPGDRFVASITSSRGVTLETVIIAPDGPAKAAVILLEGGEGLVSLGGTTEAPVIESMGFLARNADAFAAQGLLVALVGAPSDYPEGVDMACRISEAQGQDVAAVLAWIDARVTLPVWVLGMSKGSFSATNTAIRLKDSIDGFALCSASTAPQGGAIAQTHPDGVLNMDLAQIAMPALVVGHADDACPGTVHSGVAEIASAMISSQSVTQKLFTGGDSPQSPDCGPLSAHGYFGIEDQVVSFMAGVMAQP
jgi:hypothetical protein